MQRLHIRLMTLSLIIAGSLMTAVPTASGSPMHTHKPHHVRMLTKGQDDSPIPLGPITVTVVDIPVPPWLQNSTPPSTPPVTTPTVTDPQVVTTPTQPASGAATTTVPAAPAPKPVPPPPPYCLNHPDYTPPLPSRWYRTSDGNCFYRGDDNYGLCQGDQFNLVSYPNVDSWLKNGYGMGIIVDSPDPHYRMHCLITDLAAYHMDPNGYVFSGKYVQDGWPADSQEFDTPLPFPWSDWKPLYPLWVHRAAASQYVASQNSLSIQAYGLLWLDGNRYQSANSFVKYLKKSHDTWKKWKKANLVFATALLAHQQLLVRK